MNTRRKGRSVARIVTVEDVNFVVMIVVSSFDVVVICVVDVVVSVCVVVSASV